MAECETCGRDDVDLTQVRLNIWYCNRHLRLFTTHWAIAPNLRLFELLEAEQPFQHLSVYQPPPGEGYTRYVATWLHRSNDRKFWTNEDHNFVLDDFGYLVWVSTNYDFEIKL